MLREKPPAEKNDPAQRRAFAWDSDMGRMFRHDAAALALISSITTRMPSQRERSVNTFTTLPLSVNGALGIGYIVVDDLSIAGEMGVLFSEHLRNLLSVAARPTRGASKQVKISRYLL